jgi:trans-aconitate 2-methyltransferase
MATWNPELYLRFSGERTQPAWDLARRLQALLASREGAASESAGRGISMLDVGCGPGNSTAVLAALWPEAALLGMDSSPDMIASARNCGVKAEWAVADAAAWEPGRRFDAIFSNAVLQWIPDQGVFLRRAWEWVSPGGVLAIQVPGNDKSGMHLSVLHRAASPRWSPFFEGFDAGIRYHEPDYYYEILAALGGDAQVWETVYWHLLADHRAMLDWYRGTGLRPWLEALPDDGRREAFLADILGDIREAYPARADGSVYFPFRRIFATAVKGR